MLNKQGNFEELENMEEGGSGCSCMILSCVALDIVDGLVQGFRNAQRKVDQSDVIRKGSGEFGDNLVLG